MLYITLKQPPVGYISGRRYRLIYWRRICDFYQYSSEKLNLDMKAIIILAGVFAVVAVAHAYPSNMLDTFLQAIDDAKLEKDEPSMDHVEVCTCIL